MARMHVFPIILDLGALVKPEANKIITSASGSSGGSINGYMIIIGMLG